MFFFLMLVSLKTPLSDWDSTIMMVGTNGLTTAPLTYYEWAAEDMEERCVVVGPDAKWKSVDCRTETIALCSDDGKLMLLVLSLTYHEKIIS